MAGLLDGLGQFGLGDLENASLFESPEENETVDTLTPIQKQLQMEQDFLFDKTYACPVCDSEFKVKTIKVGKAKFLAGARVEHYSIDDKQTDSDKSGTVVVPRASIMYDISSYLQTRIGFSRGYRAPQIFDEDLHIETSGSRQVINKNDPHLKQENSSSFTLSFDFNKKIGGINTNIATFTRI